MNIIDIIVPIYKGEKYIWNIIEMVKKNVTLCSDLILDGVNIIFINDDPSKQICERYNVKDRRIKVNYIDTTINRGIHGVRVEALKYANGKYVLFLDQDDLIADRFLISQLQIIIRDNLDGVVCNATMNKYDKFYINRDIQELVNDVESYFETGNKIISPGCVLLKRASIPTEWISNIQTINGADDFLLWCMMLFRGKKFSINEEVLFYHVPTRGQNSVSLNMINDSLEEALEILHNTKMISRTKLNNLKLSLLKEHRENDELFIELKKKELCIKREKRQEFILDIIISWLELKEEGINITEFFIANKIGRVGILGLGKIANCLVEEMQKDNMKIEFIMDDSIGFYWTTNNIPILTVKDEIPEVDMIINTKFDDSVYSNLKMSEDDKKVITLQEIISWFTVR